ncbi:MAG: hypothetical protein MIO92_06590, partial [Methanosarcinaceae archaeon]|nr:hypothetical protein [Methanosarcinaceae archaeon]
MKKLRSYHLIVILAVVIGVIYLLSCGVKDPLSPNANMPGGKIIYTRLDVEPNSSYGIYSINPDGSNLECVIDSIGLSEIQPGCSSDGSKIAFAWNIDKQREIYVVDIDGTDLRRVTNTAPLAEYYPRWSPGDSLIAVYGRETSGDSLDIWIIRPDGTFWGSITDHNFHGDYLASWSPDGTKLVFASNRDGDYEIYTQLIASGAVPNKLTNNDYEDNHPQYSHNGEWIVFIRNDGTEDDTNYELYKMRSDGNDEQRLTDNAVNDYDPC